MVARFFMFLWLLWVGLVYEVIFDNSSRLGKLFEKTENFKDGLMMLLFSFFILCILTFASLSDPSTKASSSKEDDPEEA